MKQYVCIISFLLSVLPAYSQQQNLFVVEDPFTGLKGGINLSKEIIIPYEYEELEPVGRGYIVSVRNSKVGLLDSLGHICIPNLYGYNALINTENEVFYVYKDGKFGLVDFSNNVLIPFQYDEIYQETKKDVLKVRKGGKYGLISLKLKKEIIPCKYERIKMGTVLYDDRIVLVENEQPSDLIAILNNSKWGFVDLNGKIVVPCKYEDTSNLDESGSEQFDQSRYYYVFQGGRAPFVKNGKVGLLDDGGNEVLPPLYKHINLTGSNNAINYPTVTTVSGKQILIDRNNKIVSKEYDEIMAFDDDFVVYKDGDKYGLICLPDCKVITEAKYDEFRYANEGYIRFKANNMYGYINKAGQEVFKPEFEDGGSFYNGYCRIKKNGKYGFIKAHGYSGVYIDCEYEEAFSFDENGLAIVRKNGLYGAINSKKKTIIPFEFDRISNNYDDGLYRVKKSDLYGFYNKRGQVVVPCEYSEDMSELERRISLAQSEISINNNKSTAHTEDIMVKSMELAINDLSASMNERKDLNGKACALVRVMLMDSDPMFEGNVMGSVNKRGMQYLVYMPEGSKYLRIVPADHFPLMVSFIEFGINALESKQTYDLIIVDYAK